MDSQTTGVLATAMDNQPYASLVAFSFTPDLRRIFFVTPGNTVKYKNLTGNPRVSLIINRQENDPLDFSRSMAVTMIGKARELAGDEKLMRMEEHAARLPGLAGFIRSSSIALFQIDAENCIMVEGLSEITVFQP